MTMGASPRSGRIGRGPRLGSVRTRRLLDVGTVALAVALFAGLADPEVLLQALWVTIGIGAFLYGLKVALARIALVGALVPAHAFVSLRLRFEPFEPMDTMDYVEWPLMAGIGIIVAFLADLIATSARRYAGLYRQASDRLLTANEDERGRVARDLHDGVGQTLTAMVLTLDAAEAELRSASSVPTEHALASLRRAQTLATDALDEVRDVAARLRPARIHEIGLGAAIRNLALTAGLPVDVRLEPGSLPPGRFEPEREIEVYRIVQEAVGNAARHSLARSVWIDGRSEGSWLRLVIGDDGVGFDESATERGLGLAGMRERAMMLNGELEVRSTAGAGTTVELLVPDAARPRPSTAGLAFSGVGEKLR